MLCFFSFFREIISIRRKFSTSPFEICPFRKNLCTPNWFFTVWESTGVWTNCLWEETVRNGLHGRRISLEESWPRVDTTLFLWYRFEIFSLRIVRVQTRSWKVETIKFVLSPRLIKTIFKNSGCIILSGRKTKIFLQEQIQYILSQWQTLWYHFQHGHEGKYFGIKIPVYRTGILNESQLWNVRFGVGLSS